MHSEEIKDKTIPEKEKAFIKVYCGYAQEMWLQ